MSQSATVDSKTFGHSFFSELSEEDFYHLLITIALYGFDAVAPEYDEEEEYDEGDEPLKIPEPFRLLHEKKLKFRSFFIWDAPVASGIGVMHNRELGLCVPVFYGGDTQITGTFISMPYDLKKCARAALLYLKETMDWCPMLFKITNCCPRYITRGEVEEIYQELYSCMGLGEGETMPYSEVGPKARPRKS